MGDGNLTVEGPIEVKGWGRAGKKHVPGLQYLVRSLLILGFLLYQFLLLIKKFMNEWLSLLAGGLHRLAIKALFFLFGIFYLLAGTPR